MTFDELVKVIASHRSEGKCIGECYDAIMGNLVWPVGGKFVTNGNWRASTALRILSIREGTTREGGIPTEGFETTLQNLASCAPDEKIEQYGLKAPDRVFALRAYPNNPIRFHLSCRMRASAAQAHWRAISIAE